MMPSTHPSQQCRLNSLYPIRSKYAMMRSRQNSISTTTTSSLLDLRHQRSKLWEGHVGELTPDQLYEEIKSSLEASAWLRAEEEAVGKAIQVLEAEARWRGSLEELSRDVELKHQAAVQKAMEGHARQRKRRWFRIRGNEQPAGVSGVASISGLPVLEDEMEDGGLYQPD
ncbi:hypothetical protein BJ508DRAFT_374256 [Ascobolus immersus RN42]|uniref:Uncharacterized protein n=1 Tax=Ascobolus immersus RN42 TaxID=1160509 RepID=A0A3N4IFP0_ASCIM|nr:hypothetical protein BJ508DRAFT_374256 [Ascobolus immersus RN42]